MKGFERMSNEELALLYVKGDNKAFDELLSRTQSKLYRYIVFIVHDPDVANDIFQDTFVKAITKMQVGQYTASGRFDFWLTRIAHNAVMDWYRNQKSNRIINLENENDLSRIECDQIMDTNRETEISNEQVITDIKKLIKKLPAVQQEVVYMRYYNQLSFKEIAEITGVSINTSLGRMRYAILNLRRMAKEYRMELSIA
jgi:RNA polymerase sigma factor (sigma-70 family)